MPFANKCKRALQGTFYVTMVLQLYLPIITNYQKKKKKKKKKNKTNVLLGKLKINPLNYNLIVNISSNYQLYQSPPSKLSKNVNVSPNDKNTLKKIINFFLFFFNFFNLFFLKKKFSFFFFKFFFSNL
jgi:hypothetical protein